MKNLVLAFSLIFLSSFLFGKQLPKVFITTTSGKIKVEIDTTHAPVTGKNFIFHVKNGTFKNAVFYRVVRPDNQPNNKTKIEVIQGGLFKDEEVEKYKPIIHENTAKTGLRHLNGTISMARNEPGSASTEFFICIGNQPELDYGGLRNPDGQGFAAFGKVIKGMKTVRKIQNLSDVKQYLKEPVKILKLKISED